MAEDPRTATGLEVRAQESDWRVREWSRLEARLTAIEERQASLSRDGALLAVARLARAVCEVIYAENAVEHGARDRMTKMLLDKSALKKRQRAWQALEEIAERAEAGGDAP